MHKSGFNSRHISSRQELPLVDVTSLTISNYGSSICKVTVNGVTRDVPAFKPELGVPFAPFNLPGDGTRCKLDIIVEFEGGTGNAIIDYRVFKPC